MATLVQSSDLRRTSDRSVRFAVIAILSSVLAGCGGGSGGNNGGTAPPTPTITSVSVTCASASLQTGQTSQCSATVAGTGSYSSTVTWSTNSGTITSSGMFTAPGAVPASGMASIKATSVQDSTETGSASITIKAVPVTITSVAVVCSPPSILTTQTSACTSTVTGTGSFSSAVSWSMSPSSIGAVSSDGVFTPTTAGTAAVTATSTQDTSKSGSTKITVSSPQPTVASVAISCPAIIVATGQTDQCSATVQGTGNFSQSVSWAVSGVTGGNPTVGLVTATGLYTAPVAVPDPYTLTLTATSITDASKTSSINLIVSGTMAKTSQVIGSSGGTISLPDGSNATIPAGLLPDDQTITLTETSSLPQMLPNQFVAGVGAALTVAFSSPLVPGALARREGTRKNTSNTATAASSSLAFTFNINQEEVPSGLEGAIGVTQITDTTNTTTSLSTPYTADSQTSSLSVPASLLQGLKNSLSSITVSAVNTRYAIYDFLPSVELPEWKCWQASTSKWTDFSNCEAQVLNQRVLVVVHGMMSCVENTFSPMAKYMLGVKPPPQSSGLVPQGYGLVVGFDYDWTQHLTDSGALLQKFLEQLAKDGASQIDVVAHSEGVPVSLYAVSQTPAGNKLKNLVGLGGPVLGTPIALQDDLLADALISLNYDKDLASYTCPASAAFHAMNFEQLLQQAPFGGDLQPKSIAIEQILSDVANEVGGGPAITLAGGENPGPLTFVYVQGSPFGTTPNDGIIGLDSALGYSADFQVHPLPPFSPDFHTDLPSDNSVLSSIATQLMNEPLPALRCLGSLSTCAAAQDLSFNFTGTDFGQTASQAQFYSQDSTGAVTRLASTNLEDSDGNIAWTMPGTTEPLGTYSIFAFDGTLSTASNNVMQKVSPATTTITVSVTPATVTLSPGGTQAFTQTVTGTTNSAVIWSIQEGQAGGSISSQGVYTAPSTAGTYHVIAASVADPNATGSATVTVSAAQGINVIPASVTLPAGALQTFTATVPGGGTVTWSVQEGAAGGAITATGIYTAPSTLGTFHVVAANSANSAQTATATVKVITAVSYSTLYSFPSGFESASLIQGTDGNFYGTNEMIAYKLDGSDILTPLAQLSSSPAAPISSLIQATDGNFYGVDSEGSGSIFRLTPSGQVTTMYSFPNPSQDSVTGLFPWAGLVQGKDGNFYGTTYAGGNQSCTLDGYGVPGYGPYDGNPTYGTGCGTVFRMDLTGIATVLYSFSGQSDGNYPQAPLIQGSDGNLYGTTTAGGAFGLGVVFTINTSGNLKVLHSFSGADGNGPVASLLQASDGKLYGTTACQSSCIAEGLSGALGEVFRLDTSGNNFAVLHTLSGPEGWFPVAPLIQGNDGNFYGTTWAGGDLTCGTYAGYSNAGYPYPDAPGCGTVFKMDSAGNITVLHTFEEPPDGDAPYAGLLFGKDGYLYGTTYSGGASTFSGTVFRLSVPSN